MADPGVGKVDIEALKRERALLVEKRSLLMQKQSAQPSASEQPRQLSATQNFLNRYILNGATLPAIGSIGGGVIGSLGNVFGPLTIPAGSALGAAGAKGTENILRVLSGLDQPRSSGQQATSMGGEAVLSLAGDAIGGLLAKGVGAVAKPVSRAIKTSVLPRQVRGAIESIPVIGGYLKTGREAAEIAGKEAFDLAEQARKSQFKAGVAAAKEAFDLQKVERAAALQTRKMLAQEAVKSLPDATGALTRVPAGQNLTKAVQVAEENLNKAIGDAVEPILQRASKNPISVEPIRKKIIDVLKQQEMVDEAGNILTQNISRIIAPQRRQMVSTLVDISKVLQSNPSVGALNNAVKDLQSLANFLSTSRSVEDKVFGSLSYVAKNSLYDGLEKIVGPQEVKAIKEARRIFSENQGIFETLRSLTDKAPEQVIDAVKSALPGTTISEIVKKQPALKKPVADVVLNNLAQASTTSPQAFSKAIDKYGRDALKNVFDEATYQAVIGAEKGLYSSAKAAKVPALKFKTQVFEPRKMPKPELGKNWQRILQMVQSGENLNQNTLRVYFQTLGRGVAASEPVQALTE